MEIFISFSVFVLAMILLRKLRPGVLRESLTLSLNMGLIGVVFFRESVAGSLILLCLVLLHFLMIDKKFINFILPLLMICLFRIFQVPGMIGISFLCFRLLSATLERTTGDVRDISLRQYFFYCFYFPNYKLGPIGSYRDHLNSWEDELARSWHDLNWPQLARVAYGVVKYTFLAKIVVIYSQSLNFNQLRTADSMTDLFVMGSFLYLSLYLSFSGFNDIAIGLSHFLGFRMKENFNQPFLARSVGDFWSRWHISLTDLLKELVFFPFNQFFIRKLGKNSKYIVTPVSFILLFAAIGLWHAFSMNFFILGMFYAFGAIVAFFWPMKRESRVLTLLGVILTQIYISISFYIFHVDFHTLKMVLARITGLHL